jgi:cytoplasmic tRNA 2-thiolation protein 1
MYRFSYKIGTFCGVFRRQALDRGAMKVGVDMIVTGHNADDLAETVLMNVLRGDFSRLKRCTSIKVDTMESLPRAKPLKYTYEKEIVMYAYMKKLEYFSTECTYAKEAYRGYARTFLKDLEKINPRVILDIIRSGEAFQEQNLTKIQNLLDESSTTKTQVNGPNIGNCTRCGYMSSRKVCKACILLEGLEKGLPKMGISRRAGI